MRRHHLLHAPLLAVLAPADGAVRQPANHGPQPHRRARQDTVYVCDFEGERFVSHQPRSIQDVMGITLGPVSALSEGDRQELRELTIAVYGPREGRAERFPSLGLSWFGPPTWWVRIHEQVPLVSAAGVISRIILVSGLETRAAGITSVMTHPDHRRRGHAKAAMQRATEFIWAELKPDLALLLSSEMGVPLYTGLGWQAIPGPVFCEQPGGKLNFTQAFPREPAMVLMPRGRAAPQGQVDLCGLPW